jgi:hypothetical protein
MQQEVMTPQSAPDLSGMDYRQLETLRERIDDRVRQMRETEGPALLQEFSERAAALGLTVDELMQGAPKRRGRPSKDREDA